MNESSKIVLDNLQVRKNKAQKRIFYELVDSTAKENGYTCRQEKGYLGAQNIVVGDPDRARVIYTAHYDTCARMPFPNFITPKNIFLYLLYQIAIVAVFFLLPVFLIEIGFWALLAAFGLEETIWAVLIPFTGAIYGIIFIWLLIAGPSNRHTANDNTSGVITLLELMTAMPEEYRTSVAFVFFDLEEAGLFGSMGFAAKHKNRLKNTPLINFDCVSDGANMLFALRKGARSLAPILQDAYAPTEDYKPIILSRGVFYPSDQANFRMGIGVAALKKTKHLGILYMDRIHTKHDTVFCEKNIEYLVRSSVCFTKQIHTNTEIAI